MTRRIFLNPADIQTLTGGSYSNSAKKLQKIKTKLNKEKYQPVTFEEFAVYIGQDVNFILKSLNIIK